MTAEPRPLTLREYIRRERRRVWTLPAYLRLLLVFLAAEAARVVPTYVVLANGLERTPAESALNMLGLTSMLTHMVVHPGNRIFSPLFPGPVAINVTMAISEFITTSLFLVLPYYAAESIAGARKRGEVETLREEGLTPREILIGRSVAHLRPLLLVLALSVAINIAQTVVALVAPVTALPPLVRAFTPPLPYRLLAPFLFGPALQLMRVAILVCASALCRRVSLARVLCYGIALVALPLPLQALMVTRRAASTFPLLWMAPSAVMLVIEGVALWFLYRAALRALAGDAPLRLPTIRLPRFEGRSLWLDEREETGHSGEGGAA